MTIMFQEKDIRQIEAKGSSVRNVEEQIERFRKGFPWMRIVAPATPDRGIAVLDDAAADAAVAYYEGAEMDGKCKFVPASGAASRMFKDLFSGLETLRAGEDVRPDSAAARFAAKKWGWVTVKCTEGENIRSIEDISNEIFGTVTKYLNGEKESDIYVSCKRL